ncbi:MAG: hypothetical protein K2M01_02630 [Paramuribaculum sp.]|nr:hypothetical protein [Paramuribaculum sp.]
MSRGCFLPDELIVDAGATSSKWLPGRNAALITAPPINAATMPLQTITEAVEKARKEISGLYPEFNPRIISYYGAGAVGKPAETLRNLLVTFWPNAETIRVESDMVLAARAMLGNRRGIAAILGTGSNSCLWSGSEIENRIPSLGYILGDEGSGAVIGRNLIADMLKRRFEPAITFDFLEYFYNSKPRDLQSGLEALEADAINMVYRQPGANSRLAALTRFVADHITHPQIEAMVTREFERFFDRNISGYPEAERLPLCISGGVAATFSDLLTRIADSRHLNVLMITADPLSYRLSQSTI